jgi:GWxTD domain-containing protein
MKRGSLKTILVFLLYIGTAFSQSRIPLSPFVLNVDISRYMFPPDQGYLNVYYAVHPTTVMLLKTNDTLRGSVIIETKIINTQNDSLIVHSSIMIPIVIGDTMSASINADYLAKSMYSLDLGTYSLVIHAHDNKNPMRRDSVLKRFSMLQSSTTPIISDIDLCSRITPSKEKINPFYKNSYEVIPNPGLVFGGRIAPVVFSYAEFYNLNVDSMYSIVTAIVDGRGTMVKTKERSYKFNNRNVVDVSSLNIGSIPSGKYRFILMLADTMEHEIARSEKPIYIYNPHLATQASATISPKSAEFAGLSDDELVDEFRKAQYIASANDIKAFNKLSTAAARRDFLVKFWTDIENGKLGVGNNITRFVYLERVLTADQRYRVIGRTGWHTDRGRVYVLYGEPDEVDRYPSSDESKPYEIWLYNQIENGVQFIFVDRSGYGDYSLVHSTKRGELQDEEWRRNLR